MEQCNAAEGGVRKKLVYRRKNAEPLLKARSQWFWRLEKRFCFKRVCSAEASVIPQRCPTLSAWSVWNSVWEPRAADSWGGGRTQRCGIQGERCGNTWKTFKNFQVEIPLPIIPRQQREEASLWMADPPERLIIMLASCSNRAGSPGKQQRYPGSSGSTPVPQRPEYSLSKEQNGCSGLSNARGLLQGPSLGPWAHPEPHRAEPTEPAVLVKGQKFWVWLCSPLG